MKAPLEFFAYKKWIWLLHRADWEPCMFIAVLWFTQRAE